MSMRMLSKARQHFQAAGVKPSTIDRRSSRWKGAGSMSKREQSIPCNGITPDTIARLKARDMAAWDCVIRYCSPRLTREISESLAKGLRKKNLRLSAEEKEQVVDHIFNGIWGKFLTLIGEFQFQGEEGFFRYLRRVAINEMRAWLRQRIRHTHPISLDDDDAVSIDRIIYITDLSTSSPETLLIVKEMIESLPAMLDKFGKINPKHGEIFTRHYLNSEPIEALADEYGMTAKSVRQAMRRICKKLRKHLS
jgi:RNA polymerase sigma factor (sigma-70 family)